MTLCVFPPPVPKVPYIVFQAQGCSLPYVLGNQLVRWLNFKGEKFTVSVGTEFAMGFSNGQGQGLGLGIDSESTTKQLRGSIGVVATILIITYRQLPAWQFICSPVKI